MDKLETFSFKFHMLCITTNKFQFLFCAVHNAITDYKRAVVIDTNITRFF